MDSLHDLLANKNLDEPSEVTSLRELIKADYDVEPVIKVAPELLTLYMPSAATASLVRMRYREIERRCQLTRKLYVRIG